MTIDTNVSHAIARSVPRLVGLIAGSASFLLFGFWLFFSGIVDAGRDIAAVLIWPGIFFFGACLLAGVHRLAFGHRFPSNYLRRGLPTHEVFVAKSRGRPFAAFRYVRSTDSRSSGWN